MNSFFFFFKRINYNIKNIIIIIIIIIIITNTSREWKWGSEHTAHRQRLFSVKYLFGEAQIYLEES